MNKSLVIVVFVGVCLAFAVARKKQKPNSEGSDEAKLHRFKDLDVNNPKVQATAQSVLADITKDPACAGFTLLKVKRASQLGVGNMYRLKLRIKTSDNEIKNCKIELMTEDSQDIATREKDNPKPKPYKIGCKCADLTSEEVVEDVIVQEEDS